MQTKKKKSKIKAFLSFILKTGLAGAIIWWLISKNYDKFVENLAHINYYWLIPAVLVYIFHMFVCAYRWYKLALVIGVEINFKEALILNMKGYFFSLVIPGGAIGGDIAKVGFLNKHTKEGAKAEGVFSILMDRMVGMAAMFSLAIVVILLSIPVLMKVQLDVIELNDTIRALGIIGLILMCLTGLGTMGGLFFHETFRKIKPIAWLVDLGNKYGHGIINRFTKVIDTYRHSWKLIVRLIITSVLFVHLNIVFVIYLIMKSLGMSGFNPLNVITAVTVGNVAGLLPSNSGLGLRDVTINVILNAADIANGMTIPIVFSVILISCHLAAGLFFIFDFSKKKEQS